MFNEKNTVFHAQQVGAEQHIHDDVIKWKHFPRFWPCVRGIHWSPVNSPHKGQLRGALMFSLICVWINSWVNNGEAGDLRRHRAHYDVIAMHCHFAMRAHMKCQMHCSLSPVQTDCGTPACFAFLLRFLYFDISSTNICHGRWAILYFETILSRGIDSPDYRLTHISYLWFVYFITHHTMG